MIAFLSNKSTGIFWSRARPLPCSSPRQTCRFAHQRPGAQRPYVGFARVAQLLDTTPQPAMDIHPSAVIAADVQLGERVAIGANAVIESGVVLGDDVRIGPGCFVGKIPDWGALPSCGPTSPSITT